MAKPLITAAALLAAPLAALSGCASSQNNQQPTASPTGTSTTSVPAGTERLTAQLKSPDGSPVANATLDFAGGFATITVETVAPGKLSPGFHGLHIHSVGKCEANSVAPTGGAPGNFNSAGGHYQVPGHSSHPASGDLTSLQVRSDGSAKLVTTTDAFTAADLLAGQKTALMIHQNADNFASIPDRYPQKNGATGPDEETLATGDAGPRVACGVIDTASATATSTTTSAAPAATTTAVPATTTTSVPETTTAVPATTAPTTSIPTGTSTSTSTATITVPTVAPGPVAPGAPGG